MAAPGIILNNKQVLLSQTGDTLGIELNNSPLLFGLIELINDLSDRYAVNDAVLFDPVGATLFDYSGVSYFLTTEDKVYFKEVPLP